MTLHPATCPLDCPDACGVLVETDDAGRFVALRGNPAHTWSRGSLCGKTALYGELVQSPDRLLRPLVRKAGALRPTSWEEALATIAERVRPLAPGRVLALEYAGNMGQVARRFPGRIMNALGATRHDGGVCDNTSTEGWQSVLGHVVGIDLEEIDDSDFVLIWGADVARTVQHLQPALLRLAKRGVSMVVVDVWRSDTIRRFEKHGAQGLVLRPGTDAMLALALARRLFETGAADRAFLDRQCVGAAEFEAHARSRHDVDEACAVTGLTRDEFERLAELLAGSRRPLLKTGVGWTRRRNGALSMRAVCSLAAVKGCVDRMHYESFDHFGLETDGLERPDLRPASAPREVVRHVRTGELLERGSFDAVFVWGHNPAVTLPDSNRVRAGLAREDVFVVVHEQFLTETAELADVVLPAATFVEQWDVTRSYGHRTLQFQRAACAPPGEARGNVDAFAAIGRALGLPPEAWEVGAEQLCRELLEANRARFSPDELRRLLAHEPVKLAPREFADRGTPSGKVELADARLSPRVASWVPDAECGEGRPEQGAFALICAPSRATHNSTFHHSPRHVLKAGAPCVHVHPRDARELGLVDGGKARLSNRLGALTMSVAFSDDVERGVLRVDGMPRGRDLPEGVGINALVSSATSAQAHGSTLYSTRVDLESA